MFHIVLFEPEIPPNTGNVIRLCANSGSQLHLIEPLGFSMENKMLRRAGLDYHEFAPVRTHKSYDDFLQVYLNELGGEADRLFTLSTKGKRNYCDVMYKRNDCFVFGPETRGLPEDVRHQFGQEQCLRLPMKPDSRSLNLSNTVAIVLYSAWQHCGFEGGV